KQPSRRQQSATDLSKQLEAALEMSEVSHSDGAAMPAAQWRVVYLGPLDDSEEGHKRLFEGLQRSFNLDPKAAEGLIKGKRVSVKRTASQDDALKIVERL